MHMLLRTHKCSNRLYFVHTEIQFCWSVYVIFGKVTLQPLSILTMLICSKFFFFTLLFSLHIHRSHSMHIERKSTTNRLYIVHIEIQLCWSVWLYTYVYICIGRFVTLRPHRSYSVISNNKPFVFLTFFFSLYLHHSYSMHTALLVSDALY